MYRQQMSGTPPVYGESHKEVLNKCVETLVHIVNDRKRKKEHQRRLSDPVSLSYHPFYGVRDVSDLYYIMLLY